MIDKGEIPELAREFGLAANVEKDYVLGWLLAGIFNSPLLNAACASSEGSRAVRRQSVRAEL